MTLGTKNTVVMSSNSSNCSQPVDSTTGLVYQQAACNDKNGVLLKIALCDPNHSGFEVFIGSGVTPPTTQQYLHKMLLTEKDRDGAFSLLLSKKDFEMPSEDLEQQCTIGVRPFTGKISFCCIKIPLLILIFIPCKTRFDLNDELLLIPFFIT